MRFHFVLPPPSFVVHPLPAAAVPAVYVYLAAGHLGEVAASAGSMNMAAGLSEEINIWMIIKA